MKYLKIVIAILFTILLLGYARKTTMVRSEHKLVEQNGVVIDHHTVPKQVGDDIPVISAKVTGATQVNLIYRVGQEGEFVQVPMNRTPNEENVFTASLPHYPKATKAWYFIEATKVSAAGEVKVTFPDNSRPDFKPILLKYEGVVPVYIIIPHVLCNFAAIFFAALTLFSAIDVRRGKMSLKGAIKFPLITFILLFLGFVPFGIAMNWFAFGVTWEAVPFGRDVTDNKSQIILLFWLATLILVKGTLLGKGEERNLVSKRGYFTMVIVTMIVTIAMYAIPHSFII
ncbi:MAG TPA: hypothetical protein VF369_08775 [candidate division Zixibacteria bacterium]